MTSIPLPVSAPYHPLNKSVNWMTQVLRYSTVTPMNKDVSFYDVDGRPLRPLHIIEYIVPLKEFVCECYVQSVFVNVEYKKSADPVPG